MPTTRLLALKDAPVLAQLLRDNRDFLAPWEPTRPEDYYSEQGQRVVVEAALARHDEGTAHPRVIIDRDRVVGRITLNEIVRGPLQSCSLGYWLNAADNGRGLASAAVAELVNFAFEELDLHRVQAGTQPHNLRSQRVLERNGFLRFGLAPSYIHIAGAWRDEILYQIVRPE